MKQFHLLISLLLFVAMTGCGGAQPTQSAAKEAKQTVDVAPLIPASFNTPGPSEKYIVEKLNESLRGTGDGLSITIDASYFVDQVGFTQGNKGLTLFIEARCQCALNGSCCNLEHTFVMVVNAMKPNGINLIGWMPPDLQELIVACYDHQTPLGTMSVSWPDMQNYMFDATNGYQFGGAVKKIPVKK